MSRSLCFIIPLSVNTDCNQHLGKARRLTPLVDVVWKLKGVIFVFFFYLQFKKNQKRLTAMLKIFFQSGEKIGGYCAVVTVDVRLEY